MPRLGTNPTTIIHRSYRFELTGLILELADLVIRRRIRACRCHWMLEFLVVDLSYTWFTMDPDAIDANEDADQDGNWDCSGVGCVYEPYTNFRNILPSPVNNSRVRMQCASLA